jgi:hypothetical protein
MQAEIAIASLRLLAGTLPPRAQALVQEWGQLNQAALLNNGDLARASEALLPIPPLP